MSDVCTGQHRLQNANASAWSRRHTHSSYMRDAVNTNSQYDSTILHSIGNRTEIRMVPFYFLRRTSNHQISISK